MIEHAFSLNPFPSDGPLPAIQIRGSMHRSSNIIAVRYELTGPMAGLEIPGQAACPSRKNSLWNETCFELFLGTGTSPRYREFNISPSGHWNVYRFNDYRQGMQEEPAITKLPFHMESGQDGLLLCLEFLADKMIPPDQAIVAAVTAVVKTKDGGMTYWALVHPGPQPDFHRRDGFIIEL